MTVEHFTPDDLRAFSAAVFASAGLPQDHADIIARDLIKANLRGLEAVPESDFSGVFARAFSRGNSTGSHEPVDRPCLFETITLHG